MLTFAIIKPEALEEKLEHEILDRLKNLGLIIEKLHYKIMTKNEFKSLYGHIKDKIPNIYNKMKSHYENNYSLILKISGVDAVKKTLKLRGASNSKDALPGSIRGDYAKDQDYHTLKQKKQFAKNYFHAADSKDEALEQFKVFWGEI